MIAEPSTSRMTFAADSDCPCSGRSAWISGLKLTREAWSASTESAQAMSAALARHRDERLAGEGTRDAVAVQKRPPLTDQGKGQVREGRQVTRGTDGAPGRDVRENVSIQTLEQELNRLDPCARVTLRERVCTKHHRCTDDFVRVRLPHAAGMASKQAKLELLGELGWDRTGHEAAEARVDPVRVLAGGLTRRSLDNPPGGVHLLARVVGELGPRAADGHAPDVVDGEVLPVQRDGRRKRHAVQSSLERRQHWAICGAREAKCASS